VPIRSAAASHHRGGGPGGAGLANRVGAEMRVKSAPSGRLMSRRSGQPLATWCTEPIARDGGGRPARDSAAQRPQPRPHQAEAAAHRCTCPRWRANATGRAGRRRKAATTEIVVATPWSSRHGGISRELLVAVRSICYNPSSRPRSALTCPGRGIPPLGGDLARLDPDIDRSWTGGVQWPSACWTCWHRGVRTAP
jgi:hypothetical protein